VETDFIAILGVSPGVMATIIGAVQLIKHFFADRISAMVEADKKKLDIIWIVLVGILAVLGAAGVVGAAGWSWAAFALAAPSYWVGATGSYVIGKKVLPLPEKE
jgi:preprotein translocase subunit SecY